MTVTPNLQPPQSPFVDPKTGTLSNDGYQFLIGLLSQINNELNATVDLNLIATGTNQATALQLSSDWNEITGGAIGAGVVLSALQGGQAQTVFNNGGTNYNVFPPPGAAIDALGANQPFVLAPGVKATFDFLSATAIAS